MLAAIIESLPSASDPAAGLVAAGAVGFRRFALDHPALFQIGIQQTSVPADIAQTIAPAAERALPALHRRIARLRDAGRLGARTKSDAAWEFHATCEGLAALELRSALHPEDGQRLWHDTLSALVAGWQHVTPARRPPQAPQNTRQPARSGSKRTKNGSVPAKQVTISGWSNRRVADPGEARFARHLMRLDHR